MSTWQVVVHELVAGGHKFEARQPLFLRNADNVARLLEYYARRDPERTTYYVRACEVVTDAVLNLAPEEYYYV